MLLTDRRDIEEDRREGKNTRNHAADYFNREIKPADKTSRLLGPPVSECRNKYTPSPTAPRAARGQAAPSDEKR